MIRAIAILITSTLLSCNTSFKQSDSRVLKSPLKALVSVQVSPQRVINQLLPLDSGTALLFIDSITSSFKVTAIKDSTSESYIESIISAKIGIRTRELGDYQITVPIEIVKKAL